jgi:alpha-ketoglutarate-dependent taurine dioxygenase
MSNDDQERPSGPAALPRRPAAIPVSQEGLVRMGPLPGYGPLPLVIEPAVDGLDVAAWARNNRDLIDERLTRHGALLFRGFDLRTVAAFERFTSAASNEMIEYRDRSSPRHEVAAKIYTSTDYPPDQRIFPHNEQSYSRTFAQRLLFFCMTPAREGGRTPVADCRKVLERIRPETRQRFIEKKWMYVRNFGDGFGLDWESVFLTSNRGEVEEHCRATGIECEWKSGNRLRTRQVRPVMARHPRTGEMVWFNHLTFFHVSTLPPAVRAALTSTFADEDLPNNTFYGDGSPIEPEVLEELRQAYLDELISFDWRASDVLLIDNMLTAHAREPYVAPRRVLVAMTDPHTREDL